MMPIARRPTRAVLEQLIRETGGSMTRLATRLNVTRPTAYSWVYMADLANVVGIRPREEPMPEPGKGSQGRAPLPEGTRVPVTARVDAALWRAVRICALEEDRPASEIVEAACRAYLASKGPRS
jgi:hypothetical protein